MSDAATDRRASVASRSIAWFAERGWLWLLYAAIVLVYAFYCSAGTFTRWPEYNRYYDWLADGFRAFQLHIPVQPSAQLLAQKNPWDERNAHLWGLLDITLYDRKFYLYWGPFPAVVQAIGKTVLRIHKPVGDQYLVFFFFSLAALFGTLLLERIARRAFGNVPRWMLACAIVSFACANPVLYLVATPGVYQTAISAGQACVLGGVLFAYDAVSLRRSARFRHVRLILAGTACACALASRITLGPTIALVAVATVLACSNFEKGWFRRGVVDALCLGIPLLVGFGLLLSYNFARFGEWLEFGTTHQLSTLKFRVSPSYWTTNLWAYTLSPYEVSCRFPYLLQNWWEGPKGLPRWWTLPKDYYVQEPVVGWLLAVPVTWFLPLPLVIALRSLPRFRERAFRAYLFCVACFGVMAAVSGLAVMGLYMATMRYIVDVIYGLVLLGVLGVFSGYAAARLAIVRRAIAVTFALATIVTVVTGALVGYQGYIGQFKNNNAALHAKLLNALSVCDDNARSVGSKPRSP
jgi:hypothetical protein